MHIWRWVRCGVNPPPSPEYDWVISPWRHPLIYVALPNSAKSQFTLREEEGRGFWLFLNWSLIAKCTYVCRGRKHNVRHKKFNQILCLVGWGCDSQSVLNHSCSFVSFSWRAGITSVKGEIKWKSETRGQVGPGGSDPGTVLPPIPWWRNLEIQVMVHQSHNHILKILMEKLVSIFIGQKLSSEKKHWCA